MAWSDVDALFCSHMYAGTGAGHKIAAALGYTGIPITNLENACSGGGAAVLAARQALLSGDYETVVAVGIEKMPRGFMDMDYFDGWRQVIGHAVNPLQFAFGAARHMHEHGTTERQLALVAEKNHAHSVHNPKAMYRRGDRGRRGAGQPARRRPAAAADAVHAQRGRGGGGADPPARRGRRGAAARPGAQDRPARAGDRRAHADGLAGRRRRRGRHAPGGARGLRARRARPRGPRLVELQDTDSATEIIATEELGLCAVGEGGALVESGATRLGGRIPVNPSGGLLSKGEPVGASGLGQVYEVVNQLRGRCGARQVERAPASASRTRWARVATARC